MSVRRVFHYLVSLLPIVSSCTNFVFQKYDDVFYDGTMMAIHGLVLTSECRRTCLLTKGCLGFNMQWIRKGADVGYCDLVDMRLVNSLSSKSNYSLYGRHYKRLTGYVALD